jgi:outer membrane protein TolC
MRRSLLLICTTLFLLVPVSKCYCQESMMNPFLDKLIATAKQNYPLVKVRQEQVLIAQNTYKLSKKSWFDLVTFSYLYSPQNSINLASTSVISSVFQGYQISVSLNFKSFFEKGFAIKNAKESVNLAMLEQQNYNLTLEAEVKTRYFNYIRQAAILRLRTRSGLDAQSIMDQAQHQFAQSTMTIENYTKASIAYSESNQTKIDAEAGWLIAKSALEEIIGKKIEAVK